MSKIHKAVIYSSVGKYVGKIIGLLSSVLVARLLSPDEIGLFAIANALVIVAAELKSFGVGSYIIRQKTLSPSVLAKTTGIALLMSWGLGILLIITSPLAANFYQNDDMTYLIITLSVSFFTAPFVSVSYALLSRNFQFKLIFIVDFASQIVIFLLTILFIILGHSYFAIAIANAIGAVLQLILMMTLCNKYFSWKIQITGLKEIAGFGVYVTLSNLFRKFSISTPDLVIGKMGTTSEVAYFSRANGLLEFVSSTISAGVGRVVSPYLSEQKRNNILLQEPYLKATMLVCAFIWPALAVAGVMSYPLIVFFFGEQWSFSAPIASVLSIFAILKSAHGFSTILFINNGFERASFLKEAAMFPLFIIAVIVGYKYGLIFTAWLMNLVALLELLLVTYLHKKLFNFTYSSFFLMAKSNVILTILCLLLSLIIYDILNMEFWTPWVSVITMTLIMIPFWLFIVFLQKNLLAKELKKILSIIRPAS